MKNMKKKESPTTKARHKFLDENVGYDYILETRDGGEFTEFVTSMGGDVTVYRVYGDKQGEFKVYCR